jgi:hypothetical protein
MLDRIRKANPKRRIRTTDEPGFGKYGKVVEGYDCAEVAAYIEKNTPMPESGNAYVADLEATHSMAIFSKLQDGFFGGMPMQLGYCNGYNDSLNALEFHKSSELFIAATDCLLLLASLQDLENGKLSSGKIEAFYVSKGQILEIYGPTLHFAPCAVDEKGYKTAIALPKGTNLPLAEKSPAEPMLRMRNKWLIAHPDCERFASSGAYLGITGENIRVGY